ncbi:MAG TPA: hypothetical protein VNK23_05455 [Candidatus Dormibacteraeota bacterium]|nr:hypothetical protein [Candidatus Dormibacteraeota bacterium]
MRFKKRQGDMRNFFEQFTNLAAPKGLYCVWVRAADRERASLVARWIDPRIEAGVFPAHEEFCVITEEPEAEALQPDPDLALACAVGAF